MGRTRMKGVAVRVPVEYQRPLKELVSELQFNSVDKDLTEENFQETRVIAPEVDLEVIHFNREMLSKEVLEEFEKSGLRPANLPEALAFARVCPNEQQKYSIAVLGSRTASDKRICSRVAVLWGNQDRRELRLDWYDGAWHEFYRFLAAKKAH